MFFVPSWLIFRMDSSPISSTRNPKIINLRKLAQRKQRRAQGRFMVEGLQLIGMAGEAGHKPLEVFYCPEQFAGETAPALLDRLLGAGGEPYRVTPKLMQTLSERDAPQGLIATFPLFEARLDAVLDRLTPPALLLILDRLQDPGNMGTLIRSADAVAAAGVVLLEPCVDLFDPKTVRGTMGSLFSLPIVHTSDMALLSKTLAGHQFRLTGADGYQGEIPWASGSACLRGSVGLVLGNEARGLSDDVRPHLTAWVRLPLPGRAESLNVAVAGAVLMYQWLQVNRP